MAYLWVRDGEGDWVTAALEADVVALVPDAPFVRAGRPNSDEAALITTTGANQPGAERVDVDAQWVMLAPRNPTAPPTRVNGQAVVGGLRALRDRDEITVPGLGSRYVVLEEPATVRPMPHVGHTVVCPRCDRQIGEGAPSVRCPVCGLWYHQDADYPCWTYGEACACGQRPVSPAFRSWSPEAL